MKDVITKEMHESIYEIYLLNKQSYIEEKNIKPMPIYKTFETYIYKSKFENLYGFIKD